MVKKNKEITVHDFESDSGAGDDGDDSDGEGRGGIDDTEETHTHSSPEKSIDTALESQKNSNNEEDIDEDGRLFIRNIPFSCVEDEILSLFSAHGSVSQVHLPLDADKKCKGFGFVQFLLPEDSARALKALDGTSFQGRLLHIMLAKQQDKKEEEEGHDTRDSHLSSFQQKREAERKKMAHKRDGWNASFVRSDAVVDALSDKYGVSRGDILDTDGVGGGEMAVRLAIGETHVIQENQEYFASHGVDIEVLESALRRGKSEKGAGKTEAAKRSNTTLLIKNLPHDLVEAELEDMFTKYGSIGAFLVPKSKTVAVVDFIEPSEARRAFTGLAYRKYHHTPLYLEWAPLNTIDRSKLVPRKKKKLSVDETDDSSSKTSHKNTDNADLDNSNDFSTLFVKNLNFLTDEASLRTHLTQSLGLNSSDIRTVSLPRKKKGDQLLSMGFGFVEFTSASGASKMLKRINGSVLDGHQLEAKPSDKRLSSTPNLASHKEAELEVENDKTASTKLLVRNIAFQATQEELRGLFATFGAVKRIRIPRKMGGVHRGFAFVDFSSKKEAAMAKKALSNSHLYGRHLVIEYAKEEDEGDLSKLREKASSDKQAIRLAASGGKKRKASDALQSQEEADMADMMA
jgi:multiple RNA-binding domain-containing protein 1